MLLCRTNELKSCAVIMKSVCAYNTLHIVTNCENYRCEKLGYNQNILSSSYIPSNYIFFIKSQLRQADLEIMNRTIPVPDALDH